MEIGEEEEDHRHDAMRKTDVAGSAFDGRHCRHSSVRRHHLDWESHFVGMRLSSFHPSFFAETFSPLPLPPFTSHQLPLPWPPPSIPLSLRPSSTSLTPHTLIHFFLAQPFHSIFIIPVRQSRFFLLSMHAVIQYSVSPSDS